MDAENDGNFWRRRGKAGIRPDSDRLAGADANSAGAFKYDFGACRMVRIQMERFPGVERGVADLGRAVVGGTSRPNLARM